MDGKHAQKRTKKKKLSRDIYVSWLMVELHMMMLLLLICALAFICLHPLIVAAASNLISCNQYLFSVSGTFCSLNIFFFSVMRTTYNICDIAKAENMIKERKRWTDESHKRVEIVFTLCSIACYLVSSYYISL